MNGWFLFCAFGALCGAVGIALNVATEQYAWAAISGISGLANAFFAGQEVR